jgi:16S rRNA processing protein RimM
MKPAAASPGLPDTPERWVWLARVRRPQGRKGEVFADILTDFPDRFAERKQLWLVADSAGSSHAPRIAVPSANTSPALPRSIQLHNHWLHKGGIVLHFEGVDSISDAEQLAGLIVAIPHTQRAPLAEDEVYISDLAGCVVFDVARPDHPIPVGEIQDVERGSGPTPLLIVQGENGEVLIPFAKDYLRGIDLEAKRVEMVLPEGLTDLNF